MAREYTDEELQSLNADLFDKKDEAQKIKAYDNVLSTALTTKSADRGLEKATRTISDIGEYYNILTSKTKEEEKEILKNRKEQQMMYGLNPSGLNSAPLGTVGVASDMITGGISGTGAVGVKRGIEYGIDKTLKKKANDLTSNILTEVGELISKERTDFGYKLNKSLEHVGDLMTQSFIQTPTNLFVDRVDDNGEVATYVDKSTQAFVNTLLNNAIADAFLTSVPSTVVRDIANKKAEQVIDETYANSNYAKSNISADELSSIFNNEFIKDIQEDSLKIPEVKQAFKDSDDLIPDFTKIVKDEDELADLIDTIDNNYNAYIIKYKDDIYTKTESGKKLVGKNVDGDVLFDIKNSDIPENMKYKKINGTPILEPISHKTIKDYSNAKKYHTFKSIKADKTGNFVKEDGTILTKFEAKKLNKDLAQYKTDNLTQRFENANILKQHILTPMDDQKVATLKDENIRKIKKEMNKIELDDSSSVSTVRVKSDFDTQSPEAKVLQLIYKDIEEKGNTIKFKNPTDEIDEAIKYSIIKKISNFNKDDGKKLQRFKDNLINNVTSDVATTLFEKNNLGISIESTKELLRPIVEKAINKKNIGAYIDEKRVKIDQYGTSYLDITKEAFDAINENISGLNKKKYYTAKEWQYIDDEKKVNASSAVTITEDGKMLIDDSMRIKYQNALAEANIPFTINEHGFEVIKNFIKKIKKEFKKDKVTPKAIRLVKDMEDYTDKEIEAWYGTLNKDMQDEIKDAIKNVLDGFDEITNIYNSTNRNSLEEIYFSTKMTVDGRVYYEHPINPKTKIGRVLFIQKEQIKTFAEMDEETIMTAKRSILNFFGKKAHTLTDKEVNTAFEEIVTMPVKKLFKTNYVYDDGITSIYMYANAKRLYDFEKGKIRKEETFIDISEVDGINNGYAIQASYINKKVKSVGLGSKPEGEDIYTQYANNIIKHLKNVDIELARGDTKSVTTADMYSASIYEVTKNIAKSLITKIHNSVRITDDIKKKQQLLQSVILEDRMQYVNNLNFTIKLDNTKTKISWSKYRDELKELYTQYHEALYKKKSNIDIEDIERDVLHLLEKQGKKVDKTVKPLYDFLEKIAADLNKKKRFKNIKKTTVKDILSVKEMRELIEDIVTTSKQIGHIKYKAKITNYETTNILHKFTQYEGGKFLNAVKNASEETLGKDIVLFRQILSDINELISIKFTKEYINKKFDYTKTKTHIKNLGKILNADDTIINKAIKRVEKTKKYSIKNILEILADSGATVTEKAMQYKPIKEIIPTIPTVFEPVVTINFKGYAGYSRNRKINFQAPTPIGVLNPVFTLSHDASIMARARGDNLSLWDAVIGTAENVNDFSKNANDLINDILATDYVAILDEQRTQLYNELFESIDGFMSINNKAILNHLAEQRVLSKGKKITKENIAKEKENIDKTLNSFLTTKNDKLATQIKELKQMVEENKKEWKDDDVIAQYYIGASDTEVKYDSTRNVKINSKDTNFVATKDIGNDYLANVEPLDGIQVSLSLNGKNFTNMDFKEPDISFNQSDTQYIDNTVMLAFDKDSVANFHNIGKILHEISHHTIDKLKALGDKNLELLQAFFEERFMQGHFTDKNGNILTIDGDVTQELLSILTEKLLHNDIIASNPRLFAKAYNNKNLKALIEANSIYYKGEKITSFDNLIDIINTEAKTQFKKKMKQDLRAIQRNTFVAFKSNEQILAGLNGIKLKEKFNSTLKDLDDTFLNMNKVLSYGYNKGYAKIENIGLLEAFDITDKKEALYYALSLKDGFVKTIDDATAKFKQEFISIKNKYGITDREDKYAGNALMLGLQHFNKILKNSETSDEFLSKLRLEVNNYFNKVKVYFEDKNSVAMLSKLENTISNDALGYYSSKNKIIKVIDEIVEHLVATNKIENIDRLKIKDTLYEYAKRRTTYYKFFGKFKKIDNEYNIVVSNEKNKKINMFRKSLGRVVATLKSNDNFGNYLDAVFYHHEKYKNNENLFGVNPSLQVTKTYLVGIKSKKFKGEKKDIVGEVYIGKDKYYVVNRDKFEYTIGYQESDLLNVGVNEHMAGVYKFKVKGKNINHFINPQSLKLSNNNIDAKASTMLTRNFYYQLRKREEPKIAIMQYNQIKNAGLLLTKDDIPSEDMDKYVKLPAKNSISRIGTQYYVPKKYAHYFIGTKGIDYGKLINGILGKNELGRFVKGGIKLIIEATKTLRGTILLTHASSYINSFVGSVVILNAHTKGKGNIYIRKVAPLLNEYKALINELVTEEIENGSNTARYKELLQKIEEHKLHNAFRHGLSSTIRSSAMHLGVYEENFIVKKLNKIFKDDRAGEAFKFITLNEQTKVGAKLGEWFDTTEMSPKLALYLYELDKHNDYELAIKTVLMAYPTYYNMNGYLASFDELSPYTKYMYNIPKMLLYAGVKTPYSTTLAYAAIPAISSMSWDEDDDKKYSWFQQHGFMKIDEDTAYFSHNLNPYSLPIEWEHESLLDTLFVYNVISKGSWKPDINPFTDLE